MNTKFSTMKNPWTNERVTKSGKAYAAEQRINVDELVICDDPPPAGRTVPEGKYAVLFKKLRPRQRIRCAEGRASSIGQQLRKWLERHDKPGSVTITERYGDGYGGVWLIADEAAENPTSPTTKKVKA